MRIALLTALVCLAAVPARADVPDGYRCGPGKAKKYVGCACPSDHVERRTAGNIATCVRAEHPAVAIVFVIDRSREMWGDRLDFAKEGIASAIGALATTDQVAVIALDAKPAVIAKLGSAAPDPARDRTIEKLPAAAGPPDVAAALRLATETLRGAKVARKHVVVISAGPWPGGGDEAEVVEKLHDLQRATVSAVGFDGVDRAALAAVADNGAGRLYMLGSNEAAAKVLLKEAREVLKAVKEDTKP